MLIYGRKKIKIKILIVLTIISLFIVGCSNKTNSLLPNDFIDNNSEFRFVKPEYVEDNYMLNLAEDKNDYFKNNVVELTGIVPVSSYNIMINNQALFDLKEMIGKKILVN